MSQEEMRDESGKMRGQRDERGEMKDERGETVEAGVAEGKREIWERREGEPLRAYNMFQVYRDLGATRTIRKAFAAFHGRDWRKVTNLETDHWRKMSSRWSWVERGDEFDQSVLEKQGQRAMVMFVDGLEKVAEESNKALNRVVPKNWREALQGLNLVGSFIRIETEEESGSGTEDAESEEEEEAEERMRAVG